MDMQSSMDMGSTMASSMAQSSMAGMAMGTLTSGAMPTATAAMSSSMDMDLGAGSCKISMLWNWNTIDACFISSSWHITSKAMFAGSCIGVILLVCALEFLRRASRQYDRYVLSQAIQRTGRSANIIDNTVERTQGKDSTSAYAAERSPSSSGDIGTGNETLPLVRQGSLRPTLSQQGVRAVLHTMQFFVAYFLMLLAMYYNGYIIICILLGALIGSFIFSWDLAGTNDPGCCGESM